MSLQRTRGPCLPGQVRVIMGASMRVTLALAVLPLVVFALAPRVPVRASAPLAPTPVVSEGVSVIPWMPAASTRAGGLTKRLRRLR